MHEPFTCSPPSGDRRPSVPRRSVRRPPPAGQLTHTPNKVRRTGASGWLRSAERYQSPSVPELKWRCKCQGCIIDYQPDSAIQSNSIAHTSSQNPNFTHISSSRRNASSTFARKILLNSVTPYLNSSPPAQPTATAQGYPLTPETTSPPNFSPPPSPGRRPADVPSLTCPYSVSRMLPALMSRWILPIEWR